MMRRFEKSAVNMIFTVIVMVSILAAPASARAEGGQIEITARTKALEEGEYAVAVMHDEDSNRKLRSQTRLRLGGSSRGIWILQ